MPYTPVCVVSGFSRTTLLMPVYPILDAARDRFVLERRGARAPHDPWRYQDLIVEDERMADGVVARSATVFLTGRECPWRCAMCDLWRYTTVAETPAGAIAAQVTSARQALDVRGEDVAQMKLYNAGSFFDPRAVPEGDYEGVARGVTGLARVVVESHPSLVGARLDRLLDALSRAGVDESSRPRLEVAMGLETAHPEALERLHKRMTIEDFARAAAILKERRVALRVFLLVSPPFVPADEQDDWLLRSIDAALSYGADDISLVPTRPGNGTLEALSAEGLYRMPRLEDIERSLEKALASRCGRSRIFVDLWDLERFAECPHCRDARRRRLHAMNLEQRPSPGVACRHCGVGPPI